MDWCLKEYGQEEDTARWNDAEKAYDDGFKQTLEKDTHVQAPIVHVDAAEESSAVEEPETIPPLI